MSDEETEQSTSEDEALLLADGSNDAEGSDKEDKVTANLVGDIDGDDGAATNGMSTEIMFNAGTYGCPRYVKDGDDWRQIRFLQDLSKDCDYQLLLARLCLAPVCDKCLII